MSLDRQNYSFLERQRDAVAEIEQAIQNPERAPHASIHAELADKYYKDRQTRMDETARAVLANLWVAYRPQIESPEAVEKANRLLHQLASESWQIALALEQTREGYDCRAMRGKRQQEKELADAKKVENPS